MPGPLCARQAAIGLTPGESWSAATHPVISVVLLTHNETHNIVRCLASVAWADDIVVVDSGSTDGTQALCERLGARVLYRAFDDFAHQRNFALECGQLRHRWVLHLDADEEVTPELRRELEAVVQADGPLPAYRVPSRMMLMGQWLKHSGMYPTYQVRFGRADALRFAMVGHGQRETLPPEVLGTLRGDLIHHNFSKGISEWVIKHARYARDEAVEAARHKRISANSHMRRLLKAADSVERRRALKDWSLSLPLRPLLRFCYVYFGRNGFMDGSAGLRYAALLATYQWLIDLNLKEIETGYPHALPPPSSGTTPKPPSA